MSFGTESTQSLYKGGNNRRHEIEYPREGQSGRRRKSRARARKNTVGIKGGGRGARNGRTTNDGNGAAGFRTAELLLAVVKCTASSHTDLMTVDTSPANEPRRHNALPDIFGITRAADARRRSYRPASLGQFGLSVGVASIVTRLAKSVSLTTEFHFEAPIVRIIAKPDAERSSRLTASQCERALSGRVRFCAAVEMNTIDPATEDERLDEREAERGAEGEPPTGELGTTEGESR